MTAEGGEGGAAAPRPASLLSSGGTCQTARSNPSGFHHGLRCRDSDSPRHGQGRGRHTKLPPFRSPVCLRSRARPRRWQTWAVCLANRTLSGNVSQVCFWRGNTQCTSCAKASCSRRVHPAHKPSMVPSVTRIHRTISKARALVSGSIMKCLLTGGHWLQAAQRAHGA